MKKKSFACITDRKQMLCALYRGVSCTEYVQGDSHQKLNYCTLKCNKANFIYKANYCIEIQIKTSFN